MIDRAVLNTLEKTLPPIVAFTSLEEATGGLVTTKQAYQWNWLGRGPRRFKLGRRLFVRREDLVTWLAENSREVAA